ncbi:MAG: hypothetical protein PHE47_01295 [Oscillospiraceae bacterium]|nr:hypothetical protein [Oscillospiraceae bacterium]
MKKILKIALIGLLTTLCRIAGQLLIPAGVQTVLGESVFVKNGTMPLAFTLYGIFAYALIAAMFLCVRDQLAGHKIMQGVKYGISCCLVWVAYLWEPLPHVAASDRITYPLADGLALIVMGILLGALLGKENPEPTKMDLSKDLLSIFVITACFVLGRTFQYLALDIYSCFQEKRLETMVWAVVTGAVIACTATWLNRHIRPIRRGLSALLVGGLLFGLDYTLFNFFMPLVFDADIPDLIVRTSVDILSVTLGCFALPCRTQPGK